VRRANGLSYADDRDVESWRGKRSHLIQLVRGLKGVEDRGETEVEDAALTFASDTKGESKCSQPVCSFVSKQNRAKKKRWRRS
jgi:hypothetical protein